MKRKSAPPRSVYRKPKMIPVEQLTDADWQTWAEQSNASFQKSPALVLAEQIAGMREQIRARLRAAGALFRSEHGPAAAPTPGWSYDVLGDDNVRYAIAGAPPWVEHAVRALRLLHDLQHAEGDARVLVALELGQMVERINVDSALAKPVDDVRKRQETLDAVNAKRRLTDEQRREIESLAKKLGPKFDSARSLYAAIARRMKLDKWTRVRQVLDPPKKKAT